MTSPFSHSQHTAFKHQRSAAFTHFHRSPHPFFFTGTSCGCSVSICSVKSSQAIFLPRRPVTTTSQTHFPEAKGARVQLCPVTLPCAAQSSQVTQLLSQKVPVISISPTWHFYSSPVAPNYVQRSRALSPLWQGRKFLDVQLSAGAYWNH